MNIDIKLKSLTDELKSYLDEFLNNPSANNWSTIEKKMFIYQQLFQIKNKGKSVLLLDEFKIIDEILKDYAIYKNGEKKRRC